jgi:hypothetical protein
MPNAAAPSSIVIVTAHRNMQCTECGWRFLGLEFSALKTHEQVP